MKLHKAVKTFCYTIYSMNRDVQFLGPKLAAWPVLYRKLLVRCFSFPGELFSYQVYIKGYVCFCDSCVPCTLAEINDTCLRK